MATIYEMGGRRSGKQHYALQFNRLTKALNYAQQHLRHQLGLRSRPSAPAGLSERTRAAVRELVAAILEER